MENNTTSITISGWLPVFSGYYESIFDPDYDMFIEEPYEYDDYEFDTTEYYEKLSEGITSAVSELINNTFEIGVKYENLSSPQYYNFTNDSINVEYTLTKEVYASVMQYLRDNKEGFSEYIKNRYTSRDGFMSWYSNDYDYWMDVYLNLDEEHTSSDHCFSAALDFIVRNEYNPDIFDDGGIEYWIANHEDVENCYEYITYTISEEAIERHREPEPDEEGYDHTINRNENQLALTF